MTGLLVFVALCGESRAADAAGVNTVRTRRPSEIAALNPGSSWYEPYVVVGTPQNATNMQPGGPASVDISGIIWMVVIDGKELSSTDGGVTWNPIVWVDRSAPLVGLDNVESTSLPEAPTAPPSDSATNTSQPNDPFATSGFPAVDRSTNRPHASQLDRGARAVRKQWPAEHDRGRYLFTARSAVPSTPKRVNVRFVEIFPEASYSFDGHWRLGAGTTFTQDFKIQVYAQVDTAYAPLGWLALGGSTGISSGTAGAYDNGEFQVPAALTITLGRVDSHVSISTGIEYFSGGSAYTSFGDLAGDYTHDFRPFVTLSGKSRLSRNVALVSENRWSTVSDSNYLCTAWALRLFTRHVGLDFGYSGCIADNPYLSTPSLPLVGASFSFGKG